MITSKNILFNSSARFLLILKLHETMPPKALIGSEDNADLKDFNFVFRAETPHGFACFIITVYILW